MNGINVFPIRLTIASLAFLFVILVFGVFSQFKTSQLLLSFHSTDIPALQLSSAATRVMSEAEFLLSDEKPDHEKISIRVLVLEDSLKELITLTKDFPEVSEKFAKSPSYLEFQSYLKTDLKGSEPRLLFPQLKNDVQNLFEEYLQKKNEQIKQQVFYGYLAGAIGFLGISFFFFLIYTIYRRYQKNTLVMAQLTQNLESERMVTIQSSKLASLGEMAAGLAHEINNPLAVIIGRVEIVLDQIANGTATDLEISKTFSKINDMAVRISKIITSMRKISKGATKKELGRTNLVGVIDDILNLSSERLRNLSITIDYSAVDTQLFVLADFTHLSQVLMNLMNNAVDELVKLPVDTRSILLSSEVSGEKAILNFKDSGSGIPASVREKLFNPFFTTKEVGKGTGLGLSLSKGLMQDMGGDLELSPDLTQTCFIVTFVKA
jgi:signal transduction histidine kinase